MAEPFKMACNVLLINPRFNGASFWAYRSVCELVGAKYPAPSLGLLTVAALLPAHWDVRLIDRNVNESEEDIERGLEWADLVLAGGMLPQQGDLFALIELCRMRGTPIGVGGPDVSSTPTLYSRANFRIVGEAEGCIDQFLAAWERGERDGEFQTPLYSVDVTKTPIPRFDLLKFSNYTELTVQFSRGCPFNCEFCDIIELYGRNPRTKNNAQMLAELQRLYDLGYRGLIQFADDNLIGNKKAVKAFLPDLIAWQKTRGYPFEFGTEASLNLADDGALLRMLRDANFIAVFIGIESPDPDVLIAARKKQNTRRDIAESVHKVQAMGMFVVAGFIVGFDNEGARVSQSMIDLIEEACIPVCMVGLLYALPNTQLTRRLEREGRLHVARGGADLEFADQCLSGLNFQTLRPRADVLGDYREVVNRIYGVDAYFERVRRTVDRLDCSGGNGAIRASTLLADLRQLGRFLWGATFRAPVLRGPVWGLVAYALRRNPRAIRAALLMAAFYAHVGPFSRVVVAAVDARVADDAETQEAESPARELVFDPPVVAA